MNPIANYPSEPRWYTHTHTHTQSINQSINKSINECNRLWWWDMSRDLIERVPFHWLQGRRVPAAKAGADSSQGGRQRPPLAALSNNHGKPRPRPWRQPQTCSPHWPPDWMICFVLFDWVLSDLIWLLMNRASADGYRWHLINTPELMAEMCDERAALPLCNHHIVAVMSAHSN